MLLVLSAAVAIAVWLGTLVVRHYALRFRVLDVPNQRSSHCQPVPRGGGLAIAVAFLLMVSLLWAQGTIPAYLGKAFIGGGILVASIGLLDDRSHVPALIRFLVQAAAAVWVLVQLGGLGMPAGFVWSLTWWIGALASLALIWLVNLYNFMDGSDGLAALQGVLAGAFGGLLFYLRGDVVLAQAAWYLAAACLGFLYWNWPPAKIFLGDVGSYFIGFSLGVLALAGEQRGSLPALVWVLLLAVFIGDATFTLMARLLRRERWYAAHRSHAYQLLIRSGWSHRRVALGCLVVNAVICWPLAWWARHGDWRLAAALGLITVAAFVTWFRIQRRFAMH